MTLATLILFVSISVPLIVSPGPTMMLALSNGATYGMRIAAFGFIGAGLGNLSLICAVALGLGALLRASEQLFMVVKWGGVAYLLWLAFVLWTSRPQSLETQTAHVMAARSRWAAFNRCLTVALTNPKSILFFGAFLPQFISLDAPQFPQYALLAMIFTGLDMCCMACYAYSGRQASRLLTAEGLRNLNRICALLLVFMAAFLAVCRPD